jgi:PAS domain S-box-containing protein
MVLRIHTENFMRQINLLILFLCSVNLLEQEAPHSAPAYVYSSWRTENGLPTNDVRDVLQTRDGFIWIATVKGLVRFDGYTFDTFNSSNTPVFQRDIVNNLCEDRNGILWFAIDGGGVVSYQHGTFSVAGIPSELRSKIILKIFVDRDGIVWVGTPDGLFAREGGTFNRIKDFPGPVNDIGQDSSGRILIASVDLHEIKNGVTRRIKWSEETVRSIARLGIGTAGLQLISGGEKLYTVESRSSNGMRATYLPGPRRRVTTFLEETPGVFLAGSVERGVERLSNGESSPIRGMENQQGASLNVRKLSRDREGGIWIATGGGLLRMRQSFIWTIGRAEHFPDNHVWSVFSARNGSIWAGTETGGTVNLDRKAVKAIYTRKDGIPADRITAMQQMSDGTMWFGGHPEGLVRKTDSHFEDVTHLPGYQGGSVRALYQDRRHRVWVGTTAWLSRFYGMRYVSFPEIMERGRFRVNAIQEDSNGDIWICAGKVFRFRGDSITAFSAHGTAGAFPAWCMLVDGDRVWYGTYGSGLHLIQGDSVVSFERYSNEFGPDILSIMEDQSGKLWLNAEHELQCISKQEALDAVSGARKTLEPKRYGTTEGLSDIEFNGSGLNSAARANDGSFLYASMNGIVVVNPRDAPSSLFVPPVLVEHVSADGHEIPISQSMEVPAGTKRIDVRFSVLTYESIPKVKFRVLLSGFDEQWIDLGSSSRSVSYANLKHGSYTFKVKAANSDGIWNEEGASIPITVLPFIYQTPAFLVLSSLIVLSIIVAGYRWRIASLRTRQVILQRTVDEKTTALMEEIEIRKRREEELRTIQGDLETRVGERTRQLSTAVDELHRSRAQYQTIVDTAQEGIWMTDADDTTIFVNPKMAEILGCSIDMLIGSDIRTFLDESGTKQLEAIRERHREGFVDRYELEFIQTSGSRVSTVISASPILGADGEYQGSLAMVADVTDQKKSEKEHLRVEEELRQVQKMEAVGQLAGGIAHDFNNLLIPILGYAEMLQKELSHMDTAHRRVTTIRRAAEKAALLTKQLLSFSRRQVMESKVINLNRIIEDFSAILQRTIREDVEIRYVLKDDLYAMKGDASQIDQILINLLVNAQDAMPNGGIVTVETTNATIEAGSSQLYSSLSPGRYAALVVTDSGKGIPSEIVSHIFEPFFTTKDKSKGTGLGLATVYGIVKQHSGHIWVDSSVGSGTSFTIYFPADEESTPAEVVDGRSVASFLRGSATIVVTEDDDLVRQFACSILEEHGYNVHEAATGEACIEIFRRPGIHVDLLLTDVVMPVMNGRELYAALSAEFPRLRVVYMSGYSGEVISHKGILEEGVVLLQKPFTAETLLKRIQKSLRTE